MKEIKEMMRDIKKSDKMSEVGENMVNEEEKKEERSGNSNKSYEEDERELKPWARRVELPILEGADPMEETISDEEGNVNTYQNASSKFYIKEAQE